ncbi:unnamed protein product, partial [marine sediment metagenome]
TESRNEKGRDNAATCVPQKSTRHKYGGANRRRNPPKTV